MQTYGKSGRRKMNDKEMYEKALDKACNELMKMCQQTKCRDCHFVKEQIDCDNNCPVQGNYTRFTRMRCITGVG